MIARKIKRENLINVLLTEDDNGNPKRKDWFTEQSTVRNGGINDERL